MELASAAAFTLSREELTDWAERAVVSEGDRPTALAVRASAIAAFAASWNGEPTRAQEFLDRAERTLERVEDATLAATPEALLMLSLAHLFLGGFARAAARAERGLRIGRAYRQDRALVALEIAAAMAYWNQAQLDRALAHLDAAEDSARLQQLPYFVSWALWMRVMTQRFRGDVADLARVLPEARALTPTLGMGTATGAGLCNIALSDPALTPQARIDALLEAAGGEQCPRVDPLWATTVMRGLCEASVEAGRIEDARAWADRADALATQLGHPLARVRADGARLAVLLADGDDVAAAALAPRVVADARALGATLEALVAQVPAARALAAAADTDAAISLLQATLEEAGACGAGMISDAAAQELRRLGARPSAAAARARAGSALTAREREIAQLAGQGLPNKQIAAAVFLSEKTVESHLSRIYAKLGVRGRTELAGRLAAELS